MPIPADVATKPSVARQLAEFVTDADRELPPEVLEKARLHALDALGVGLAAVGFDFAESIRRAGLELDGGTRARGSTALGVEGFLSSARAALVNGVTFHGLDFDDTHIAAIYHASAPALAAAIAVGEETGASMGTMFEAFAIGLEIGCRLSLGAPGAFHARGFHPTGISGTFAAACVAARLRGVGADVLANALGLCGSMASGILEIKGSWLKRLHPGWAASSGISAVTLASNGFQGPPLVFEGPLGLFESHVGAQPDLDAVLGSLGDAWHLLDIAIKPYPCCHFLHAGIDAARELRRRLPAGLGPEGVARIEVGAHPDLFGMVVEPVELRRNPKSPYDALFSLQYVVGVALHEDDVTLDRFYGDLADPEILAWTAKIDCYADEESGYPQWFPGEVAIVLNDGEEYRERVEYSKGTSGNPVTAEDIVAKFVANAQSGRGREDAQRLAEEWLSSDERPVATIMSRVNGS